MRLREFSKQIFPVVALCNVGLVWFGFYSPVILSPTNAKNAKHKCLCKVLHSVNFSVANRRLMPRPEADMPIQTDSEGEREMNAVADEVDAYLAQRAARRHRGGAARR